MPSLTRKITKPATGGVLLRDKPAGITSHDVVEEVRRELGVKAGHTGTLDPFATGLLIVLLGRATRLQRYFLDLPKTYVATARLGWRSSTGDPDGELEHTGRVPERLALPTGTVEQQPPMTSAVKVGGERLYRKAHRGEVVERPLRQVQVYRADLLERSDRRATFEIECSSGTYIRSLIETLGDAYCERLRRTAVGRFSIDAVENRPLSVDRALGFLPERRLTSEESERVRHGSAVSRYADTGAPPGKSGTLAPADGPPGNGGDSGRSVPIRLTYAGRVLAVARARDDELKPEVVLA